MVQQHNDIDNKMANVVNALSELKSLFADHASCYDKIAGYVEGMRPLGDSRLLNDRKAFLLSSIKQTVEKLRQVCSSHIHFWVRGSSLTIHTAQAGSRQFHKEHVRDGR